MDASTADRWPTSLITAPWPGPGNSEGPADPDVGSPPGLGPSLMDEARWVEPTPPDVLPVATDPWPGPGNSEGPA